jgi:hypothetical protein
MTILDRLTKWHGRISDQPAIWFPFVFLKPAPDQLIGPGRRLAMTFCFAAYAALFWPLKQWLFGQMLDQREWGLFGLKSLAFFALWFRLVTCPLWNRRARNLPYFS